MSEKIPLISNNEGLPFSEDEIEGSEEMRRFNVTTYKLPEGASITEIIAHKRASEELECIAKATDLLGFPKGTDAAEVIKEAELREPGWANIKYYLSLGLDFDPNPSDVQAAEEERANKRNAILKKIGHAMQVNRALESSFELVPFEEEISVLYERITKGKPYELIRKKEDERGLYLWDIKMTDPNERGETVEYSYMRKGKYKEGNAALTAIHVTIFDTDGMPVGGESVTQYLGDTWVTI